VSLAQRALDGTTKDTFERGTFGKKTLIQVIANNLF